MKCEIVLCENCEERAVIYVKEKTPLVEGLLELIENCDTGIIGYKDKEIVKLLPQDIYCITVYDNKVCAICENQNFILKERLYTVSEKLPLNFVKINKSNIANIQKIEGFDASISGTLKVRFKNGYTDYVSRRQIKLIKERFGI